MNVRRISRFAVAVIAFAGLPLTYQACSAPVGARTGHGYSLGSSGGGTTTDNPKPTTSVEVAPFVSEMEMAIQLCVEEIRMRSGDDDDERVRIELPPAQRLIALNPSGTFLSGADIKPGQYSRIELRLSNSCDGISARKYQGGQNIMINEEFDMRFSGEIRADGSMSRLTLDMGDMIDAIAQAQTPSQLSEALTTEGSCSAE